MRLFFICPVLTFSQSGGGRKDPDPFRAALGGGRPYIPFWVSGLVFLVAKTYDMILPAGCVEGRDLT